MIKCGLSNKYKVDPYGTEEILSDESVSLAPKLTIDYGDEVQEAEFTIRPTKGSLDTNISPVAVLNSIKGNTIAWNQLVENGDFSDGTTGWSTYNGTISVSNNILTYTVTSPNDGVSLSRANFKKATGHKFLFCANFKYTVLPSLPVFFGVEGYWGCSFPISSFIKNAWVKVSGIAVDNGAATGSKLMIYFRASNMSAGDTVQVKNAFAIDLTLIYGSGNEPTTPEIFEADYYKWFGKQLTYDDYDAGSLRSCKMSGIKTTDDNSAVIGLTPIPVTTLKGKLNGEGSSVVVFPDGMKSAGDVRDEIKTENNVVKAINRVGTRAYEAGDENGADMTTDGVNYTNYALSTTEEYVVDEVSVKKIMTGGGEVKKVCLGSETLFEQDN